ncbi:MAG TPA: alanine racemase [Nocardioidaceae bacterium]|nr:alanine racemase [Nocardioidaceae bacterium]
MGEAQRAGPAPPVGRRAEAVVDLDAISHNVAALRAHVGGRDLMAIVKADGYGHGLAESARAARAGGASWLGVAFLDEALQLRRAGDTGPLLSWLAVPGEPYEDAMDAGVEVGAYSVEQLAEIAAAAGRRGGSVAVQLKVDSGLGRGGASPEDWPRLVAAAKVHQNAGLLRVTGVWSHLARSDEPGHPTTAAQADAFKAAVAVATEAGLEPEHLHLANSGGALAAPETWCTMVRPGIAAFGLSPLENGASPVSLRPAMTLRSRLALVKEVPAGHGVSYGHTYVTPAATTLGLVPLGYADGVPRHASGGGPVVIRGRRLTVAGRVCMDQFVVDLGDLPASRGDEVVLFGDPATGVPSAADWAAAAGTIDYEIVTRIGARVPRRYVGRAS